MPLPEATGQAIAAYLRDERPKTQHRMVFARHMTPRERPIGPDLVRKTIRQAYARAGLPHTRSHLLRHTMASRLLAGGSSLKEVADVLRHRSLNTTLIYAKLDSGRLVEVALPWPGILRCRDGRAVMTIGLTALVERYLTERRTLGFQLRSTAYSLRSLAEYVRRTRHRGPLTLEVMAEWARLDSHASVDPRTWARRLKQLALLRAMDAAVRAGHRSARRHDLRSAARAPGTAHLQPRGSAAVAGCRARTRVPAPACAAWSTRRCSA